PVFDCLDVLAPRSVAGLAVNAGGRGRDVERALRRRRRGMARKAAPELQAADPPRHGFLQRARCVEAAAGCEVEVVQRFVIADARLLERSIFLEQERLADVA